MMLAPKILVMAETASMMPSPVTTTMNAPMTVVTRRRDASFHRSQAAVEMESATELKIHSPALRTVLRDLSRSQRTFAPLVLSEMALCLTLRL